MKQWLQKFYRDETGASAVEYGLLVAGIAIAALVAIQAVGTNLSSLFQNVAGNLTGS